MSTELEPQHEDIQIDYVLKANNELKQYNKGQATSNYVWIPHATTIWQKARIIERESYNNDDFIYVYAYGEDEEKKIPLSSTHVFDLSHDNNFENIADMNNLHEAPLIELLRKRFKSHTVYTLSGEILISINPYIKLPDLYDLKEIIDIKKMGPHVFLMADKAYNAMKNDSRSQSLLVSGESGSGKTEASKYLMRYLASISERVKGTSNQSKNACGGVSVEHCVLQSNPLMEAFGNAKTIRNDNSSRFGKFIQIFYDTEGSIFGATTSHFLLEKSRIVDVSDNERNYHIFYQMCAGLSHEEKELLKIGTFEEYNILNPNNQMKNYNINDEENFTETIKAMEVMGIDTQQRKAIWSLLAAILHMGNLIFTENEKNESSCEDQETIQLLADLLQVEVTEVIFALSKRTMRAGLRGSFIEISLTSLEAQESRNGLCKAIYSSLFDWLVLKINESTLKLTGSKTNRFENKNGYIGILDIFGFEILQTNSFEQFCINYANEMLQQQFSHRIFLYEQQIYLEEGIDWRMLEFEDNHMCLNLIQDKPNGILPLLDEQAVLGRRGSDAEFLQKLHQTHLGKHVNYKRPRFSDDDFIIKHYAGEVVYSVEGFLDKNNDSLHQDLLLLMNKSHQDLLQVLFPPSTPQKSKSTPMKRNNAKMTGTMTVGRKFREQMNDLMEQLNETNPWYVRCVKPNENRSSHEWNAQLVMDQLCYLGVMETVRIRRSGYPIRKSFNEIFEKYNILIRDKIPINKEHFSKREGTQMIVQCLDPKECQVGHRKVFLRDGQLAILDQMVKIIKEKSAIRIQSNYRKTVQRRKYLCMKLAAIRLQSMMRMFCATTWYMKCRRQTIFVQSLVKRNQASKKYYIMKCASILIQSSIRKCLAQKMVRYLRIGQEASTKITALVRMFLCKRRMNHIMKGFIRLRAQFHTRIQVGNFRSLKKAASKINASYRSYIMRKMYLKQQMSIRKIQSICRGFLIRMKYGKDARKKIIRAKNAQILISCVTKGFLQRLWYKKVYNSIIKIQNACRVCICSRKFAKQRKSICCIQSFAKMFIYKKRFSNLKIAATNLNSFGRMIINRKRFKSILNKIILLQSTFRMIKTHKVFQQKIRKVIKLQAFFRSRKVQKYYCNIKFNIHLLQRFAKMIIFRQNFQKTQRSVRLIQCTFIGFIHRKKFHQIISKTILIQACWRMSLCRKKFLLTRKRVLIVQNKCRLVLSKMLKRRRLCAILRLQVAIRMSVSKIRLRKMVQKMFQAAEDYDLAEIHRLAQTVPGMLRIRDRSRNMMSLAHVAAKNGDLNLAAFLLERQHNLDQVFCADLLGNIPLHYACLTADFEMVKYMAMSSNMSQQFCKDALKLPESHLINTTKEYTSSSSITTPTNDKRKSRLFGSLSGSDPLHTSCKVIKEGYLKNASDGIWIGRRYFTIDYETLACYKSPKDKLPIQLLELMGSTVRRTSSHDYGFSITSPRLISLYDPIGELQLIAESEKEIKEWLQCFSTIKNVVIEADTLPNPGIILFDNEIRNIVVNKKNNKGLSPLHIVVQNDEHELESVRIAAWLVENGGDLSSKDNDGNTPLHLAVQRNRGDLVEALIEKGAKTDSLNNMCQQPKDMSTDPEILQLITTRNNTMLSCNSFPLLGRPKYNEDLHYMCIFIDSIRIAGAASIENPFLKISIMNSKQKVVSDIQVTPKALIQDKQQLWWGYSWHIQHPIEFFERECVVIIELSRLGFQSNRTESVGWTYLPLQLSGLNTGPINSTMYLPPINPHSEELAHLPGESFFYGECNIILKKKR